jgi:hypothetical protein
VVCLNFIKLVVSNAGIPIPSYSKPPSEELAPSYSAEDLPPPGFSDEIREEIKKEFYVHQARMDSLTP